MLMPSPVMVISLLSPFLYVQVTPLCVKVAEVVLAVTIPVSVLSPVHFVPSSVLEFNFPSTISALITPVLLPPSLPPSPVDTAHGVKLVTDWLVVYFANIFISLDTWVQVSLSILLKLVTGVMVVLVPSVFLYLNPPNSIVVNALLPPIAAVA